MNTIQSKLFLRVVIICTVLSPSFAHAYIDPGAGSYFLQILMATLFAGVFGIERIWGWIKSRISLPSLKKKEGK